MQSAHETLEALLGLTSDSSIFPRTERMGEIEVVDLTLDDFDFTVPEPAPASASASATAAALAANATPVLVADNARTASNESLSPASAIDVGSVAVSPALMRPLDEFRTKQALKFAGTLKKRLAYVAYKVQHGLQNEPFDSVKQWTEDRFDKLPASVKRSAPERAKKLYGISLDSDQHGFERVLGTAMMKAPQAPRIASNTTGAASSVAQSAVVLPGRHVPSPTSFGADPAPTKRAYNKKARKNSMEDDFSPNGKNVVRKKAKAGNVNEDALLAIIDQAKGERKVSESPTVIAATSTEIKGEYRPRMESASSVTSQYRPNASQYQHPQGSSQQVKQQQQQKQQAYYQQQQSQPQQLQGQIGQPRMLSQQAGVKAATQPQPPINANNVASYTNTSSMNAASPIAASAGRPSQYVPVTTGRGRPRLNEYAAQPGADTRYGYQPSNASQQQPTSSRPYRPAQHTQPGLFPGSQQQARPSMYAPVRPMPRPGQGYPQQQSQQMMQQQQMHQQMQMHQQQQSSRMGSVTQTYAPVAQMPQVQYRPQAGGNVLPAAWKQQQPQLAGQSASQQMQQQRPMYAAQQGNLGFNPPMTGSPVTTAVHPSSVGGAAYAQFQPEFYRPLSFPPNGPQQQQPYPPYQ
ncbi:hypothetical protein BC830DRAFT_1104433 [Chytriomyces sp. MP71]|nr:hypothetical protein BC830DRAFT_1104433 [Chytriomyces sp. MP71]